VAGLSHELNNPLGIILGFAQGLLRKSSLDEASRTALLSIEKQTQRCAGLVRALLDFSRRTDPQRERIDVGAMLARVREKAGAQALRAQSPGGPPAPTETMPVECQHADAGVRAAQLLGQRAGC
jgi:signal transduction histidine kinase